jgi:hypothetical protein
LLIVLLSPMIVFVVLALPWFEMWTLVIGAPPLTFWNCMPMSPNPRRPRGANRVE